MSLLVVAAWEPELERFRAVTRDVSPQIALDVIGIGLVDAAAGMTRCIAKHDPSHVLLLGTCGAAPTSNLAIGDVVALTSVRLLDGATIEGHAAMPFGEEPIVLAGSIVDAAIAGGARAAVSGCPLGMTTCDTLANKLAAAWVDEANVVEHLEAYSVARACQAANIPCAVVLGVANIVGACGREQWRAHHVAASAKAAEVAHVAVRTSTTARSPA